MRKWHVTTCLVLGLGFLPQAGAAQNAPTAMSGSNCGQFLQAVEISAEREPKGAAQTRAVQAAQDEVVITLFWVHGYLSGKTGQTPALDSVWLGDMVGKLSSVCRESSASALPIAEAVKKL